MKSSSTSVGARVDDAGLGGPLWSPVGGGYDPFIDEPMSSGSPRRATIKAHHPTALAPTEYWIGAQVDVYYLRSIHTL